MKINNLFKDQLNSLDMGHFTMFLIFSCSSHFSRGVWSKKPKLGGLYKSCKKGQSCEKGTKLQKRYKVAKSYKVRLLKRCKVAKIKVIEKVVWCKKRCKVEKR